MPGRELTFYNQGIYHIFNKTIDKKRIFLQPKIAQRFMDIFTFYRSSSVEINYSKFSRLEESEKNKLKNILTYKKFFKVHLLAYCLMPTHFHLLLLQIDDDAISHVMSDLINSFTRHYNISHQRLGPLFLPRFKAVSVTNDPQLMHVSRYIHLNPYSSKIITNKHKLQTYFFSSYSGYVSHKRSTLVQKEKVMELFLNKIDSYKKFVMQNADYQESLEHLKHTYNWR